MCVCVFFGRPVGVGGGGRGLDKGTHVEDKYRAPAARGHARVRRSMYDVTYVYDDVTCCMMM